MARPLVEVIGLPVMVSKLTAKGTQLQRDSGQGRRFGNGCGGDQRHCAEFYIQIICFKARASDLSTDKSSCICPRSVTGAHGLLPRAIDCRPAPKVLPVCGGSV